MNIFDTDTRALSTIYSLKYEKDNLDYYKQQIFENEREMSRLAFDRDVGLYALTYDRLSSTPINTDEDQNKKDEMIKTLGELEHLSGVQKYKELMEINDFIKREISRYYIAVNCALRSRLCDYVRMPGIYVKSQNNYTHIVDNYDYLDSDEIKKLNLDVTLVEPVYEMESKRDLRHFYNKTSFHYLESMLDDLELEIDGKKLGKVLIKQN